MRKILFFMIVACFVLIPTAYANNYTEGLLDTLPKDMYTLSEGFIADNDITTHLIIRYPSGEQTVKFALPVTLHAFYHKSSIVDFHFYLNKEKITSELPNSIGEKEGYRPLNNLVVDEVKIQYSERHLIGQIYEIDFFGDVTSMDYVAATNVTATNITERTATINYTAPENAFYTKSDLLINDVVVAQNVSSPHEITGLTDNKTYEIKIRSYYKDGKSVDTVANFKTKLDNTAPSDVQNLTAQQVQHGIELRYSKSTDSDISHYEIYRNNVRIANEHKSDYYVDKNAIKGTATYRVVAVNNNGNKSTGANVQAIYAEIEVAALKSVASDYTNVLLMWQNPQITKFEKVKIYRKIDEDAGIAAFVVSFFTANDQFTPIFETNGTNFKDLTVEADTEYTYKVTTIVDNNESDGVTTTVKTPEISVMGVDIADGDPYVISWQNPKKGKILVKVGGQDYKTVNAVDLSVSIPKKDMKYDFLNNPDVQLVPIDDAGQPIGIPTNITKPGTISGGSVAIEEVTAEKAMLSAVSLLGVVGLFVLLGLAFRVVPRIVETIRNAYDQQRARRSQ